MTAAVILVAVALVGAAVAVAATPTERRGGVTSGYVIASLLLVLAGVVVVLATRGLTLGAVDEPALARAIELRSPGLTTLAEGLALFGGTTFTGGAAVVTAAVLAWRRRWAWVLCWVITVAVGASAIRGLKLVVQRLRPPELTRLAEETTSSLPSGHALMAALGLGLTAAAVVAFARAPWLRWLAGTVAVVLAAAIGGCRIYLGVHWTSDVVAGWLIGAALATAALTLARDLDPVVRRPAPAVDERPTVTFDTQRGQV